ncbi:hypothetical protein JG687_00002185 [Phytophthora cactorum]|uniref:Uncharacterized protein n=1 Tax=Phytophthora cactorum TaxID=29920 RepID=A0A8T1UVQ7_9STRA|nr:hypothetical protein JG687_00002185 [Phytophthora cactorum]
MPSIQEKLIRVFDDKTSNHCNANDGDIYYYTGKEAGDVLHTFKTLLTIRSGNPPNGQSLRVWATKHPLILVMRATEPSGLIPVLVLSYNWFDPNMVGDEETESGNGEEEWKAYGDIFMNGLASAVVRVLVHRLIALSLVLII